MLIWVPVCGYCVDQLKKIDEFKRANKNINVVVVGTYGDIQDALKKHQENSRDVFIYDNDPKLPLLRNLASDLIQQPNFAFPFYVFFNEKGEVIGRMSGSIAWDQWGNDIAKAKFD